MKGLKGKLVLATCMICMVSVMDMAGNKMLKGFAVATVISLFTGVAIISIVAGQIVKPVSRLADMVEKREFTREIKINSKDEIGRLAKGFNEMFQSLQRLLEIFAEAAESIKESSMFLGNITREVADGADKVKNKMDGISGTAEVQNQSVSQGRDKLECFQKQIASFNGQFADIKDIVGDIRNKVADNAVITKELEMSTNISLENMGKLQDGVQVLEDK